MTDLLNRLEGVALTEEEENSLLPHFLLLIIGKPGSGKSRLTAELVKNESYYRGKFNKVLVVSPSAQKLGIAVKKEEKCTEYSLPWIFDEINKVNEFQVKRMEKMLQVRGIQNLVPLPESIVGEKNFARVVKDKGLGPLPKGIPPEYIMFNKNERFFTAEILHGLKGSGGMELVKPVDVQQEKTTTGKRNIKRKAKGLPVDEVPQTSQYEDVDEIERELVAKLEQSEQEDSRYNLLFIFDDVVGDIKANENNFSQAQLFFNRRHLIANGTISIIVVSEKYTMIPQRIRSSANWLILFRLNPVDFDSVYKDAVTSSPVMWHKILEQVFDIDNDEGVNESKTDKKYDHLDIMVEHDLYFKNFEKLTL